METFLNETQLSRNAPGSQFGLLEAMAAPRRRP